MRVPDISTGSVSDVTPVTAKVSGVINGDGNSPISETGFVYTVDVAEPTVMDSLVLATSSDGYFITTLTGLKSSRHYNVRAYAKNEMGIGYGQVESFTTGNATPTATGLSMTGLIEVTNEVTAVYTYVDAENDPEDVSTIQWYVAEDASGQGETAIAGATEKTYLISESLLGKYIRFGVTPKAVKGNPVGTEVKSVFSLIRVSSTVTFTYNNKKVIYGIITSTTTGRKWLDRNLGAAALPGSADDQYNAGDLFQWGRGADGHQVVGRPVGGTPSFVNGIVGGYPGVDLYFSSTDNPGHPRFIAVYHNFSPLDWRRPQNHNLWQGVDGINNPCPSGWRVPTEAEFLAENLDNINDGYTKFKLSLTGVGHYMGEVWLEGAGYWTSTTSDQTSRLMYLNDTGFDTGSDSRAFGHAVRCIKDAP